MPGPRRRPALGRRGLGSRGSGCLGGGRRGGCLGGGRSCRRARRCHHRLLIGQVLVARRRDRDLLDRSRGLWGRHLHRDRRQGESLLGNVGRRYRGLAVDQQRSLGAVHQRGPAPVAQRRTDAARDLTAPRRPTGQRQRRVDQRQRGGPQLDGRQVGVRHPGAVVLDIRVLLGFGGQRVRELLGEVDRAGHLHRVRGRAIDRNIDRLVGVRVDGQAGAGRPDLGLVEIGNLAFEQGLLIVGAGQLQAAQHAALAGLSPGPVTGPQHADGELAVRIELGAEVAAYRGLALLLADLLDACRRRGSGVGPVLRTGEGPHVDGLGHFEPVVVGAADDGRGLRHGVGPGQAVAADGSIEGGVVLGAGAGHRIVVDVAGKAPGTGGHRGNRGDQPGDQQGTQSGEQQRPPGRGRLQSTGPAKARPGGSAWAGAASPCGELSASLSGGGCFSGASNIRSILTGPTQSGDQCC
ncbi:hypothetical protein I545_5066 [Mycobacterium kansasii 662]|uniref:Uncharacterized protein n=1 Tax=Mycobacterium kansasii 662 TaxID=1299326 RepID=X7Z0W9_MYCKA|nr:hypothetical protein I545_5066 [Mycobacterium kansasii 662]